MAIRSFCGIQTLSGSAQPVFGTTASAAFTPPPDQFGGLGPGSNQTQVSIPVVSSAGFIVGDQVVIGPAAAFKPGAATTLGDVGTIKSIPDSTHLVVQGLTKAHASGEYVVLDEIVGNVRILPVTGTAGDLIYIGTAATVSASDSSVIDVLWIPAASSPPVYWHDSESIGGAQPLNTASYWVNGTNGDEFCARFTQV